jgi:Ca2+-binding RTX toxin-like protein
MELLVPLFAALIFGAAFLDRNEGDDDEDPAPPSSAPTEGDDVLAIGPGTYGLVDAMGGNDTITAVSDSQSAPVLFNNVFNGWAEAENSPPLVLQGGAGDDDITISGLGMEVYGGAGADVVRVSGASNSIIFGGAGDTIFGQDIEDLIQPDRQASIHVELDTGATFVGGSSNEYVFGGSSLSGGGGDDLLASLFATSDIQGGDGDDTIAGNAPGDVFASGSAGADVDTLSGGAGWDQITGSYGDIMTGGEGHDSFAVYTHPDTLASNGPTPDSAVITDFNPAEDLLGVLFDDANFNDGGADASLVGRITTDLGPDGSLRVLGDGVPLVTLQGITTANVGVFDGTNYVNLDGTPANQADFDVFVNFLISS